MTTLTRFLVTVVAALMLGATTLATAGRASGRHTEMLPPGITKVDVRSSNGVSRHVTDLARVAKIVRWFDALPIAPSAHYYCPMIRYRPPTTFAFRAASGARLAFARTPGTAACGGSFDLTIQGHVRKPVLVGHFLVRVGRLLGMHLIPNYR